MGQVFYCNRARFKVVAVPPVPMVGTGQSARPLTDVPEVSVLFEHGRGVVPDVEEIIPRFESAYLSAGEEPHVAREKAERAAKAAHDRLMRLITSRDMRSLAGVKPEKEMLDMRAKAAAQTVYEVARQQNKSVDELLQRLPHASEAVQKEAEPVKEKPAKPKK